MTGSKKVVRTVCMFAQSISAEALDRLDEVVEVLIDEGIIVQTKRLCSPDIAAVLEADRASGGEVSFSVGRLGLAQGVDLLEDFCNGNTVNFNIDLTEEPIGIEHVDLLLAVIRKEAGKTFNFTYTVNNAGSSPFFPSATYVEDGFAIGLQPTNLSVGCSSIDEWLARVAEMWSEIDALFASDERYVGLDTSIAPLSDGPGSFVDFLDRIGLEFDRVACTDLFLKVTSALTPPDVKTVGLCGLMLPCLEDSELAREYEKGNFSVERCLFLSLHSGLGLDAYPVGVDESPERIAEILTLMQGLSIKHNKPLSARFISDGRARIGDRTDFGSPYLTDVMMRAL